MERKEIIRCALGDFTLTKVDSLAERQAVVDPIKAAVFVADTGNYETNLRIAQQSLGEWMMSFAKKRARGKRPLRCFRVAP